MSCIGRVTPPKYKSFRASTRRTGKRTTWCVDVAAISVRPSALPTHMRRFRWQTHAQAVMFRTNKYNLRMCYYSFELLMEFCLENHYLVLLRLMNQYMNIQGLHF